MKQRNKKIKAIISINIILIMIILLIYSKYYNSYAAGSLPTGSSLGFNNMKGSGAGTLSINGIGVYCLNHGQGFNYNLLSSEKAANDKAAARSGKASTKEAAQSAAEEAQESQRFDGKLAKLKQISGANVTRDATMVAVAKALGYSKAGVQQGLWNSSALSKQTDLVLSWGKESNFKDAIQIEAPSNISYDGSGNFNINDVKVTFPKLGKLVTTKVTVSTGSISGTVDSGNSFEVIVPYKGNETTKKVTITASITYPSGVNIIKPAEYYQIYTQRWYVNKASNGTISRTNLSWTREERQ